MDEDAALPKLFKVYFELVALCLSLQKVSGSNTPTFYGDFLQCIRSFLYIYTNFFEESLKNKEELFKDYDVVLNKDEIELPAFRKILTKVTF